MSRSLAVVGAAAVAVLAAAVAVIAFRAGRPEPGATPPPPPATQTTASGPAAGAPGGSTENCRTRSEATFGKPFGDPRNLVVGPLVLVGGSEFTPASVVRSVNGQKYPVLVRAGHRVTLAVPDEARASAGLGYGRLPQGEITLDEAHKVVTFTACPANEPAYSGVTKTVGATTFWSGAVVVDEPRCVPLDVYVDDEPTPRRVVLELGVRPCLAPQGQV
jgi:hypothetical protein